MSLPVTSYTCTKCDFTQGDARTWGVKEYVLENGLRIPLNWSLGWCHDCNGLAAVEALSETVCREEMAEAQSDLDGFGPPPVRRWWQLHRFLLRGWWRKKVENWMYCACDVEDARDALRLVQERKSPPRCLACGSRRVDAPLVTDRSEWKDEAGRRRTGFIHPGCGGEIMQFMNGDFRLGLRPSIRRYTAEGEFIEQEFVEGYTSPRSSYFEQRAAKNNRIRGLRAPRPLRYG
jgi:hypothetical protein